ncbi:MAG: hypothetical protein ACLVHV_09515 [Oscillospiraceae bacterium]
MDKVFRVELSGGKPGRWCELELPATYYGLFGRTGQARNDAGR